MNESGIIITAITVLGGIIASLIKLVTDYRKDHNMLTTRYGDLAEKTLTSHNKLRESVEANTRATNRGAETMQKTGESNDRIANLILEVLKTPKRKKNVKLHTR